MTGTAKMPRERESGPPPERPPLVDAQLADEQTVLVQTSYGLVPIGWVQSARRVLDDTPNQRERGAAARS